MKASARVATIVFVSTNPNPFREDLIGESEFDEATSALQAEIAEQKDRYLRLAADFDNYRKRLAQEIDRRAAAQKQDFIRELLPVIDNLERALASEASTSNAQLREGVRLTLQQLQQLLRHHGVELEDSLGHPFDPHRHEALSLRRDPSRADHTVLEVFQPGYRYGNQVLRPAKVVVNDLSHSEGTGDGR